MSDAPEDRDVLAAEYALGCLEAAEMRRVEAMAGADPTMRAAIAAWNAHLSPLAALAPPVAPPAQLWARLEQSIGGGVVVRPRFWRNATFWRGTTAAALALAAAFAGVFFFRPPAPVYVAALAPVSGPGPAFMVRTAADGALLVSPVTPTPVATGRDLELWALPPGAQQPISLGVLPASGKRVPPSALTPPRTQILVSLEPAGGSPTGQPTGPVLFGGVLD